MLPRYFGDKIPAAASTITITIVKKTWTYAMTHLSDTHSHSYKRSKYIAALWRSEYVSVNQLPASLFDGVESLVFRLELRRE